MSVVVPEKNSLEEWAAANKAKGSFELLCKHPEARKHVLEELNYTARKHQVRQQSMKFPTNSFDEHANLICLASLCFS